MSANIANSKVFAANKAGNPSWLNNAVKALTPHINVTVSASAGSGKTYLLVSRIIRLLLEDNKPNSIVAITFTRKAAGEMLERLNERLYELAAVDEDELGDKLQHLGLDLSYSERARTLYENLLLNPQSVKITTFHAFCHDLLQRFPLEAGIDPGFELLESSTLIKHQAWQRLLDSATKQTNSEINSALDQLFNECSNPLSVEELLLNDFLEHRGDWWAFTEGKTNPVSYAIDQTHDLLQLDKQSDNTPTLTDSIRSQLKQFSQLLQKHPTKTNTEFAQTINTLTDNDQWDIDTLKLLHSVFFTSSGTLRKRNTSKTQIKNMGEEGEKTFLVLHQELSQSVEQLLDKQYREKTAALSQAWYTVGDQLLSLFQAIKREQNCLDFSDLEWQVYQLLSNNEQSHWVQYKLDQRIDHILIDEFQDTNPTQWHMLYPLLDEITTQTESQRSLFIVGDGKQSIYRFRRAAPDLFIASQSWLANQPSPHHTLRLDQSRRSSSAIINLVNQVFFETQLGDKLLDFQIHDTVHQDLWGRAALLPLIANTSSGDNEQDNRDDLEQALRNPLETPREVENDERYQQEGQCIAEKITELVNSHTVISENGVARTIDYGDIMILMKKRRHVADYENALLAAGIPFIGTQRKSLLSTLEVQDLLSLCNTLLTPHSNLALAVVLRSPIFSCSDEDLSVLAMASKHGAISWYSRLALLQEQEQLSPTLGRAYLLLTQWQNLIGSLPVHDLLDHIYHQGNIIARYMASFPDHYAARAKANLTRFIELALEIDSGRYPSLQKFIYRLELLDQRNESPDESLLSGDKNAVRLLTIHSAKGLEAPVVFLADATNQEGRNKRHHTLIDWPADKKQPDYFFVSSMYRDSISKKLIEADKQKERIEDANLLYVALTRARQCLYISGVEPRRGDWKNSWYGQIAQQVDDDFDALLGWSLEAGQASKATNHDLSEQQQAHSNDTLYNYAPIAREHDNSTVAPTEDVDSDATAFGDAIHRLLELLTCGRLNKSSSIDDVLYRLRSLSNNVDIDTCWRDALAVYTEPELQAYFNPAHYQSAYNEVNVNAMDDKGRQRFGIIDRLIVDDKQALIIDYKSRQNLTGNLVDIASEYREQLSRYCEAVKLLWPDKSVRAAILFTAQRKLVELDL